jgi:flagellin
MIINHNISSMKSQGALFQNNRMLSKDLHKLSTGLRINSSSDDAAGLAVSEGLRAQVRGQEQAKRNTLDGISALNIADGAYNEIHAILQRQRELAVQSATATYSSVERGYMDLEFQELNKEIDRIVGATKWNKDTKLLDGGLDGKALQVDANNTGDDQITLTYEATITKATDITTDANATTAIGELDDFIKDISEARANIGSLINRLESTVNNLTVSITNQQAAESQIRDLDFAYQSSQFTKNQILTQSATAMLTQANATTQGALSLIR